MTCCVRRFTSSSLAVSQYKAKHLVAGGSPGLVVMGDDLCLRGCGFEYLRCILDGLLLHLFVVKIVLFV